VPLGIRSASCHLAASCRRSPSPSRTDFQPRPITPPTSQINLQTFFPPTSANLSPTQVSLFALSHPHSPLFPLSTKVPLGHATYHAPSESLLAQTKDGLLQISEVQVAGKRRVSAEEGWRGFRDMGRVMRVRVGIEEEVDVVRFLMGGELDVIREELKAARKKKNSSG
jgi:hypothetical protein